MQKSILMCVALFFFAIGSIAAQQITVPQPSPAASLTQKVGLTDITVNYSRPSSKGRKVFGDLVAFNTLWRTGANGATKFKFSTPVIIDGKKVEAGEYALLSIPSENEWTMILSKNANTGTADYKESDDALRFKVKPMKTNDMVQTFTISLGNLTNTSTDVEISWENTKAIFKIDSEIDATIMKQIDDFAKNPNASLANNYSSAASYYFNNDKDLNKALEWINKAVEINPDAFWLIRTKSLIQAKMKNYKEAIKTAELSLVKSTAAKNNDYIKMNTESIKEWSGMK
ncbi:MAG: DUF2911 domain-containing protein [Bacteroidetes bacterium]|nr:MAG: DUF2911 domain-containing protein [Bacteroidota bacterium]